MHTVELLQQAIALAERLGYTVRQEWLTDAAGGACELKGRKYLFLDLSASPLDQLDQVLQSLRREPINPSLPLPAPLAELLLRKSA